MSDFLLRNQPRIKAWLSIPNLFIASVLVSPLLLLTVQGWMTRISVVCALLGAAVLWRSKAQPLILSYRVRLDAKYLCAALTLPLVSVLLGQLFNWRFMASSFDSPVHIFVAAFVFLAMTRSHSRVVEWLSFSLPLALLLALISILIKPGDVWGLERVYTNALDPLAFGSLALTFGLLSLISIKLHTSPAKTLILYKLMGFGLGMYLSMLSGSRTGWLALPLVMMIWAYADRQRFSLKFKLFSIVGLMSSMLLVYSLSNTVQQRVDLAVNEVVEYQWSNKSVNPVSSVGDRISFIRMAYFFMVQKPLSGWGEDGSWKQLMNHPDISFADQGTKNMALFAGFHNEITSKMVQSGVWGLISSVSMFLLPAILFMRAINSNAEVQRNVALMGMVFLLCQFVSSWSMELTNLRYAASFYGLMIAIFSGQILYFANQDELEKIRSKS